MDAFEYKVLKLKENDEVERALNHLGEKGWELVSFSANSQLGSTKYSLVGVTICMLAVFKRKVQA